jgi:hypothetical protein
VVLSYNSLLPHYIRLNYHYVIYRNKKALNGSPKLVYIKKDQERLDGKLRNRQNWLYIEESIETTLELVGGKGIVA